MNRKIVFKHIAIMLLLAVSIFSCLYEPTEIPVTEYSIYETDCWWAEKSTTNKVFIINNSKELKKHISCEDINEDINYPTIDFSKYTLLLVCIELGGKVYDTFFQEGRKEYNWKVSFDTSMSLTGHVFKGPHVILVPKLSNKATIKCEVKNLNFITE